MKMSLRPALAVMTALLAALVLALLVTLAGCTSDPSIDSSETTAPGRPATTSSAASTTSSTTPPVTLSPIEKELADTANMANLLVRHFGEQGIGESDPRSAIVYGLRARVLALSCRKALDEGDLANARGAMSDVYSTLNRGRNAAQGETGDLLETAHASIETVGDPSDDPEGAATDLDEFIAVLEPLLVEAATIIGPENIPG